MTVEEREALKKEFFSCLHCAIPGIVDSFDPETQTVTVRPAVKGFPLLRDVPVFFPGTRSSAITWMVQSGDECLVIFADSAIDRWVETGETATPLSDRSHDLSDAFAFVGFRSRPNALQSFPDEPSFFGRS